MYSYSSILKCLIVAVALSAVVFVVYVKIVKKDHADDWKPKRGLENVKIHMGCFRKTTLSREAYSKLENLIFLDESEVRQYVTCVAIKWGIFSEQQGYNAERLARQYNFGLPEEEALQIAQSCIDDNSQKSPTDVWAFRGNQCVMASKIGDTIKAFMEAEMKKLPRGRM
ncbi:general odorant-binding protein 99a-like [Drosophila eugracilis]|uniref:general odorant-binding protein 99a-like n=1 Tax=Drosophila eugracilis TaxID=29029 RepID=UPI001BDA2FCF|nr:general odorant-binding protein 99a-like [Drosophila eugracilis]